MNVLIACEESQTVCLAFREKGHNAFSCDLQEPSGGHPEFHVLGDVTPLLNGHYRFQTMDGKTHEIPGSWDLIIAHPPCTYFCKLGTSNLYRKGKFNVERWNAGLEMKKFFLSILNANCPRICVENPTPCKRWELPPYSMACQPWEFGEPYSKRTCLWLKGLPYLMPTCIASEYTPYVNDTQLYTFTNHAERSRYRSKTFRGIAMAMAEQWG